MYEALFISNQVMEAIYQQDWRRDVLPYWFIERIGNGIQFGGGKIYIKNHSEQYTASYTDWLICVGKTIYVISDEEFRERWDIIKEPIGG